MGILDFLKKKEAALKPPEEFTSNMVEEVLKALGETTRKVVYIELKDAQASLTDSKFGGLPYLPKGGNLPKGQTGEKLFLLAQFNLAQLPEGHFPIENGILQFWIADGDCYGLDFDNPLSSLGNRVVYYDTIDGSVSAAEVEEQYEYPGEYFPVEGELKLSFTPDGEAITSGDFRFDELFAKKWNGLFNGKIDGPLDLPGDIMEDPYNRISGFGHKLLGYPAFTQQDPRDAGEYEDYILLFQMDSVGTDTKEIMWGDAGIANFFIREEDLLKADFTKILYSWDCY